MTEPTPALSYADAYRPFWHPVAFSTEVSEQFFPVRLLGTDLLVRRFGGKLSVIQRHCPHRGADLLLSNCATDGVLECRYHGWAFDVDGKCLRIPSQPGLPIPPKANLNSFRVEERHGLVWVCLVDKEKELAPLPAWPELSGPNVATVAFPRLIWKTSAGRMIENIIDVTHLSWLHQGTFGNPAQKEVPAYEVLATPNGLHVDFNYPALAPAGEGRPPKVDPTKLTYDVTLPFICRLAFKPKFFFPYAVHLLACPVDEESMVAFYFASYDVRLKSFPKMFLETESVVLEQDRAIVESLNPRAFPVTFDVDVSVRADQMAIEYRRALARLRMSQPPRDGAPAMAD